MRRAVCAEYGGASSLSIRIGEGKAIERSGSQRNVMGCGSGSRASSIGDGCSLLSGKTKRADEPTRIRLGQGPRGQTIYSMTLGRDVCDIKETWRKTKIFSVANQNASILLRPPNDPRQF
jgi:hypothetical protein